MSTSQRSRALVAAAVVAMSVAGCSGSASNSGAASKAASRPAGGGAAQAAARPAGVPGGTAPAPLQSLGRPPTTDRDVVYTADLTVRTRDVADAADRAQSVATTAGGYVFSSATAVSASGEAATSATVVLKVPPASFGGVLRSLAALGTALGRNQQAEDVTDQVVDIRARVQAQQASVARVRTLLAQARTIGEVVSVESELTKREADLESLQGRQRALDDQVALSTITLHLVAPSVAAPVRSSGSRGFLAGLSAGWDAFVGALQAGLTVLGAVLPFAVGLGLVLLIGLPLRRLLLARRRAAGASS